MCPRSALPEHLNDPDEIDAAFPDDSQFGTSTWFGRLYRWYNKTTKTWFAFGYRCTEPWAKWRKVPKTIFAVGGPGKWRYEDAKGESVSDYILPYDGERYLSRLQYYKRWHFAVKWPLIFTFHFYWKAKSVPKPGKPRPELDGTLFFAYLNHFDADYVYWMVTSVYIGFNWK